MSSAHVLFALVALALGGLWAWFAYGRSPNAAATPGAVKPTDAPAANGAAPKVEAAPAAKPAAARVEPAVAEKPRGPMISVPDDLSGPVKRILVHAVGSTDPGRHRDHNEDAYTILEDAHLFVVADGMGRHAAGEVASQICVDTVRESFRSNDIGPPMDPPLPKRGAQIRHAILEANTRILHAAQENDKYAGMGTTVVSAVFSPYSQRAFIAHVGDSRCYRLRGDEIKQLTADHTLGAAGFTGKRAVLLSRAVGVEEHVDVDVGVESPQPDDVYLLCSDGLTRMVDDALILSTVREHRNDLDMAVNQLIALANERGGRDNITAILVRVDDAPL
jgi:serine/threonine protein phosphatase PrpC